MKKIPKFKSKGGDPNAKQSAGYPNMKMPVPVKNGVKAKGKKGR